MNDLVDLSKIDYVPKRPLDLQGWNGNAPIFEELISKEKPKIIAEVGSWKGQSTISMAKAVKKHKLDTKIYCIDTWLGAEEFWNGAKHTKDRNLLLKDGYPSIYFQFLDNVFHTQNQDIVIPIPNTSHIGSLILKYRKINPDLIYIDASHEYLDVLSDLNDYYSLLNNNKIIFGDDFSGWPTVRQAVIDFCKKNSIKFDVIGNNFWLIRKN